MPHPDYLLDLLTARQLSEWQAYDELEPIGIERIEYCIANLCSIVVNIVRSIWGKRGTKMTSAMDFMPCWDIEEARKLKTPKRQSIEEMKQILKAVAIATGKKLKTNKDR